MRSAVAEALRDESRARIRSMSGDERVALAHRLGDEDAARYASFHGLTLAEARRRLRAAQQVGRRPSCASRLE